MRPKAVTAAFIGDGAWAAIGGQQGVYEHEQGTGKLARGLMGARDAWWRLPTAMPSIAGGGEERRQWDLGLVLENWQGNRRNGLWRLMWC
jgi:hypothetical protein